MSASSEMPHDDRPRRKRGQRVRVAMLGIALVLLALLIAAWLARRPIATHFVDRTLAADRVPARYTIAELGFGSQRLTDVVIGDPRAPDLVADWIELGTDVGLGGVGVRAVRAGHVRVRARLVDGRLSLGALDRLLPKSSSTAPFTLPAIALDVADARIRLETPQGLVGVKLSGAGRLDDGFAGQVALVADRLDLGACRAEAPRAVLAVRVRDKAPHLTGPVRAMGLTCGNIAVQAPGADLDVTLGPALDRWDGRARVAVAALRHPAARLGGVSGTLTFAGTARDTQGDADLAAALVTPDVSGAAKVTGHYAIATDGLTFGSAGAPLHVALTGAQLSADHRRALASLSATGAGTPLAPLAAKLGGALEAAARAFDLDADLHGTLADGGPTIAVSRLTLAARSGARLAVQPGADLRYAPGVRVQIAGVASFGGGGLPEGTVQIDQSASGERTGLARIAPYGAGGARLALAPAAIREAAGAIRATTRIELSGPLGNGRVERLALPLDLRWNRGVLALNPACAPLSFASLAYGSVRLAPATLGLCPIGPALVELDQGRARIGAAARDVHLTGRIGDSPLAVAAASVWIDPSGPSSATGVAVRLGATGHETRLDVARLDAHIAGGAFAGTFAEAGGQIGNVPLLLSKAAGDWRLAGGTLTLGGALTVSDAAAPARFKPLAGRDLALTFAGNRIAVTGTLATKSIDVANVTIRHDLSSGSGSADIAVPGIAFGPALQPDDLTPLTYGVVADVKGRVTGSGHIAWSPAGVTSTGAFTTPGLDLAAAFGPVTGIAGTIRFTDLLALQSAPGQTFTIAAVNPGVAVENGTVSFQTLPGARIAIESGRWPFAGGALTLEPTLLDFAATQQRRLTFRVAGVDAAQFLQQFDFKNLDATGIFDGTLPMVFDLNGGRIEKGALAVREGGGTLAYVGQVSQEDLGTWGNFAFQALKSIRYRNLGITMNGPLAGEMVTAVRFAGVSQGMGAKRNFLVSRLAHLPLIFNVTIRAPFRSLIDSAASFYDPSRLIQRNLPALIEEQNRQAKPIAPIQPPASRTVP